MSILSCTRFIPKICTNDNEYATEPETFPNNYDLDLNPTELFNRIPKNLNYLSIFLTEIQKI